MRIEYQDPSEASDAINDMLAQLADIRATNRALLAQLDEERASHAKSQEAYDNATAALADRLADMTRRKDGWRGVAMEWRKRFKDIIEENQSEFLEFNEIVRYFRERKGDKE